MPAPLVIDLSHHNTVTDWDAIAAAGIRGVIHKATEDVGFKDSQYAGRRQAALNAGLLWGAYHFLRPGNMQAQARFFLKQADPDAATLIAADHEDDQVSLDSLKAFLTELESATGRSPVIYGGHVLRDQLNGKHDPVLAPHRLWFAHYTTNAQPNLPSGTWDSYWLWQFTDKGDLPGIKNRVDLNTFAKNPAMLAAEWSGIADAAPVASNDQQGEVKEKA